MADVQITEVPIESEPAEHKEEPRAPESVEEEEQSSIRPEPEAPAPETPAPKKRGRPAGSRNRPKA